MGERTAEARDVVDSNSTAPIFILNRHAEKFIYKLYLSIIMTVIKGKILKWGNSFGIRLEKASALHAGLQPNEEVEVDVKRKITKAGDVFGTLKTKADTEKVLREIDELFEE